MKTSVHPETYPSKEAETTKREPVWESDRSNVDRAEQINRERKLTGGYLGDRFDKVPPLIQTETDSDTYADLDITIPKGDRRRVWFRKLMLSLSGQIGSAAGSFAMLWLALGFNQLIDSWLWQPLAALMFVRIWYFHTRGPKPILINYQIRKRFGRTLVDEGQISVVFLAICFVAGWPISLTATTIFVVGNLLIQFGLMSFARLVIKALAGENRRAGRSVSAEQQAIIIGTGNNARRVADMIMDSPELETRIIGFLDYRRKGLWRYHDIPLVGHPDRLENIVANTQVDAVFWAVDPADIPQSWQILHVAEKMGVSVFVMPDIYDPKLARVRPTFINGLPSLVYRTDPESQVLILIKNCLDWAGALIGLVLFLPVTLLTILALKLESKGPILFRQTRLGLNGKPFQLYKFRTMAIDAEERKQDLLHNNEMSGPVFKMKSDPRITKVGKFLRKFSIDEIPQLLNILKGEMSLVGPRPPLPEEVRKFEAWQHRKLSVKPGLTCLWQVNGRNDIDFEEWMQLDLRYIDSWSLWLDAKIIAKTFPTVVRGSGR